MTHLSEISPRKVIDWTSYSGLTLHRKCPQAWHYRYLLKLSRPPQFEAKPELHFGNFFHALRAAESIERGRRLGSIKYVPANIRITDEVTPIPTRRHVDGACDWLPNCKHEPHWEDVEKLQEAVFEAVEKWGDALPEDHAEEWRTKLGSNSPVRLLKGLNARYNRQWKDEIENERPIGVEVKWVRELPGSDVVLLGYTDEVYFDVKRNVVVVRDHKTSKRLGSQSSADDLLDSQLDLNAWGLKDRIEEWGCAPVQAIAFNRALSVKPTTPKLIKSGKLSKTVTNFDLMTYLAFCKSEEAIAAGYEQEEAQIERLSSPAYATKWFQRTLRPINRNIVKAHLQAAVDTNQDAHKTIDRALKRGEAPRNMTGSACSYCDFAKLCRAQMVGGVDGEYELSEYGLRHKESEQALAEALVDGPQE